MINRPFSFGEFDAPTAHNLDRLEHFSKQNYPLSESQIDDFLIDVIGTHTLLPNTIRQKIFIHQCYTCGSHIDTSQERRDYLWSDICADLVAGLNSIREVASLQIKYAAGPDRPITKGERILALCSQFDVARDRTVVVDQMIQEGGGSPVYSQSKELLRLLGRKRIPNANTYDADINRRISTIKMIAQRLHHLA